MVTAYVLPVLNNELQCNLVNLRDRGLYILEERFSFVLEKTRDIQVSEISPCEELRSCYGSAALTFGWETCLSP